MSAPSLAELRAKGQPQAVLDRLNDEHWFGRLYMRKVSPYATWVFARLGWSPNAVTLAYIACGIAAGVVIAFGGLVTAMIGAVLIQGYLLFDCSDGELARWTGRTSAGGIYLDLVGHYLGESALLVGLAFRAQGHLTSLGRLRHGRVRRRAARHDRQGRDRQRHRRPGQERAAASPRRRGARSGESGPGLARKLASVLRLHRITQAVELSVLILLAAIVDSIRGGLTATRVLLLACLVVAALMVVAHLVAVMASRRLR